MNAGAILFGVFFVFTVVTTSVLVDNGFSLPASLAIGIFAGVVVTCVHAVKMKV